MGHKISSRYCIVFGATSDIEYFIKADTETDTGGTKSIFGLAMFVGVSRDIEYYAPLSFYP